MKIGSGLYSGVAWETLENISRYHRLTKGLTTTINSAVPSVVVVNKCSWFLENYSKPIAEK